MGSIIREPRRPVNGLGGARGGQSCQDGDKAHANPEIAAR